FIRASFYDSQLFVDERGSVNSIFPNEKEQKCFGTIGDATDKPFSLLAADGLTDLNYLSPAAAGTKLFPLYRYDEAGNRADNITDWALKQFQQHYKTPSPQPSPASGRGRSAAEGEGRSITKQAIFHYCYAVLHDPLYREKYALNLKREFPRIPFYADFWQWAAWGEALMALHIGYESVAPFALSRSDIPDEKARAAGKPSPQSSPASGRGGEREKLSSILAPKALLRADKEAGSITLDSETTLRGIPPAAWHYKLGNRCALEWILDQYKEKKPKDPTIREKFDTYRFADYKEKVIDLLLRVTTVSVETERITEAMKAAAR
ncbi:MAG: type ISP restriction/modification enzyme, partial [Gallionella sp.]